MKTEEQETEQHYNKKVTEWLESAAGNGKYTFSSANINMFVLSLDLSQTKKTENVNKILKKILIPILRILFPQTAT